MKVNLSSRFKRTYKKLPSRIKKDFDEKIVVFVRDPNNPSLKTHKLNGRLQTCLAFRLCDGYRVLFEFSTKNIVNLLDIGSHDKYRKWKR